jgi:TonB family protein
VFTPAGERLVESNATTTAGEAVHFSTTRGAATYTIDVTPDAPGVWTSTLKVSREGNVIYTETVQQSAPRSIVSGPTPPGYQRVGGGVTAPTVLKMVEPAYTPEAKAARIAGIVILQVMIDETGVVRDTLVLKNLPFGLGEKAAEAVRQWTFAPGTMDGKPVPVIFNITVNFKGDGEK